MAAVVVVAAVAVCFLTNPATGEEPAADSPSAETDEPSSAAFTSDDILVEGATGSSIPAFVVQTAREYVAASAGDWDSTGASNEIPGHYDVTEAEITSFVLQPTSLGGQTEDGSWALDFYGVNYRLRVEPPENFMPVDNLSVDENGYLNYLVYLLFYNVKTRDLVSAPTRRRALRRCMPTRTTRHSTPTSSPPPRPSSCSASPERMRSKSR